MRTLLLASILLLTIYSFNSCSICSCKKVSCSAFEDVNFISWFPYQSDQQVIFKYQSAFDTITLQGIYKSEAYEARQGCYNGDDGCHKTVSMDSKEIAASSRRKLSLTYFSQTPFGSSASTKSISLYLQGFNCTASDINDQGLVLVPGLYNSIYSPTLSINGTTFNNVQAITRDTTIDVSAPLPFKVYLSKGIGLIAYEMFPSHQLWVKQ
jgi:hypothetical protein